MLVEGKPFRTVWAEGPSHERPTVLMIDQNRLPFEFAIHQNPSLAATCLAIKDMTVRGAGAIGATAGFAMAQGVAETDPVAARKAIEATRPTAQNLFYATKRVFEAGDRSSANSVQAARIEAEAIANEDVESCRKIGEHGAELIADGQTVMTHCNAGWLAFVDYGSALSPVYVAKRDGKNILVYASETRPRAQGGRLTAWELHNEGVAHLILPDTASAQLMQQGKVDLIIVGADRIAANGDTANKIGTLDKAIVAAHYDIPFYIAAPTSTIDLDCPTGDKIPIEQRSEEEVLYQRGRTRDGRIEEFLVNSPGSHAINPAFDVTPEKLITGIITQNGIFSPGEISRAL